MLFPSYRYSAQTEGLGIKCGKVVLNSLHEGPIDALGQSALAPYLRTGLSWVTKNLLST